MNNGFQMGYDGGFMMDGMDPNPVNQMRGTWISKINGTEVLVKDCVMTGEGMSVMLNTGEMIDMNTFSNEYYQMSEDMYDIHGNKIGKAPSGPISVPAYDPSQERHQRPDLHGHDFPKPPHDCGCDHKPGPDMPRPPHFDHPEHHPGHHPGHKPCPPYNDPINEVKRRMDMIKDVFDKVTPSPVIACDVLVNQTDFPKDQLQMLIDIFGIKNNDIATYLYKYYYTPEKIIAKLKDWLVNEMGLKDPSEASDDKDGCTE